jgi:transposase
VPGTTPIAEQVAALAALQAAHHELSRELETTKQERDEYRRVYLALLEAYRKLEAGLIGQKRERFVGGDEQLVLSLLAMLTQGNEAQTTDSAPEQVQVEKVEAHERKKPTGRKPLPEHLPRILVEIIPPEVQHQGLDAFERLGEDTSEIVEHRPSSLVVVRTVRPKFVPKRKQEEVAAEPPLGAPATEAVASTPVSQAPAPEMAAITIPPGMSQSEAAASTPVSQAPAPELAMEAIPPNALQREAVASTPVLQAPALELPIPRSLCGPGLLADTIVRRWQDHLPLHRLERIYGREGLELPRSTVCGWHASAALLLKPLIDAMWKDALSNSPYLCTDATGVLVQALEKCRRAHFFVVVAPRKHVLFGYSPQHNSAAVDKLLAEYKGFLVADAHAVYDHLYRTGDVVEVGCWAHARRYWFKSLDTDGSRARHGLSLIQALFKLEREYATAPPEEKLRRRQQDAKPALEAFFRYCDEEAAKVLDETPIAKAIGYARNQRVALSRFLKDGRLPIHNNHSENALRREALGRKNWLFLGSDDGGTVNATFVTLLASCQLHDLEPLSYLRDLLCLLPGWPIQHVLELAPANWRATIERPEVRAQLDANVFRQVALGVLKPAATE